MKAVAFRVPYNNVHAKSALGVILNLRCFNKHSKFILFVCDVF